MAKHKHYDIIVAWAEGKEIEYNTGSGWFDIDNPSWDTYTAYRVKLEPKPDTVRRMFVEAVPKLDNMYNPANLALTFDGETGKLKSAEVIHG